MENTLKTIEESENNKNLLTAALKEITVLKAKLEEIKSVAFGSDFYYSDDDEGILNLVPETDIDSHKVGIIQSMVMFI